MKDANHKHVKKNFPFSNLTELNDIAGDIVGIRIPEARPLLHDPKNGLIRVPKHAIFVHEVRLLLHRALEGDLGGGASQAGQAIGGPDVASAESNGVDGVGALAGREVVEAITDRGFCSGDDRGEEGVAVGLVGGVGGEVAGNPADVKQRVGAMNGGGENEELEEKEDEMRGRDHRKLSEFRFRYTERETESTWWSGGHTHLEKILGGRASASGST